MELVETKLDRLDGPQSVRNHFLPLLRGFFKKYFDAKYLRNLTDHQMDVYKNFDIFFYDGDEVIIRWTGINGHVGKNHFEVWPCGKQPFEVYSLWQKDQIIASIRKHLFQSL